MPSSTNCCSWPWRRCWPPPNGRWRAPTDTGSRNCCAPLGQSFADHARYASLLLQRRTEDATARRIRAAVSELTARAAAAGTVHPDTTAGDVMALIWAMRGLVQATGGLVQATGGPVQATGGIAPGGWQRFLDIHLAGLQTTGPVSGDPSFFRQP